MIFFLSISNNPHNYLITFIMATLTNEQLEQKNQKLASAVELSEDELDQAAGGRIHLHAVTKPKSL